MGKSNHHQDNLPGITNIIAFLIGVLLFLLFGETLLGVKPEAIWIVGLMGLSVSAIIFWVWREIHPRNGRDDHNP